jgi:hypothetical protein
MRPDPTTRSSGGTVQLYFTALLAAVRLFPPRLQDMGYDQVYNLGGFKDAAEAGFETERA